MQESDGLKPSVHLGPLIEEPDRLTKNVVYWKDNLVLCWSSAYPPSPSPPKQTTKLYQKWYVWTRHLLKWSSKTQSLLLQI